MPSTEFQPAPLPTDEATRLRALRDLEILDTDPEPVFDDLTALAAQIVGAPVALVSLVDADRQWFKSRRGLQMQQTPRDWSFCAHAILEDGLMEVPDARADPRFAGNPLVVGAPGLRFYAGVALRTAEGHALGTLCVLDRVPRRLDPAQREALARLGRSAVHAIEARRAALRLQRAQQRLHRLAAYRALLAGVSQAVAHADDERQLLQQACDLALRHAGVGLVYVARPDVDGRFRFLASAGRTDYLGQIVISTHEHEPQGRGFAGRAWREGRAFYTDDFLGTPELNPWHEAAGRFGLRAGATLPIRRAGQVWAVMTILDAQVAAYDEDLRELLGELAQHLSRGLDRIDLAQRERESSAMRDLLLDHSQAAIVAVRDGRLVRVNPRSVRMLGFDDASQLLALPPRDLAADESEYAHWQELDEALREHPVHGHNLRLRRRDGSLVSCDVSGGVVDQPGGRTVVWTLLDIGERAQLQRQLERALAYQRRLMDRNAAGLFTIDDGAGIRDVNPALCELLGQRREQLLGRPLACLLGGEQEAREFTPMLRRAAGGMLAAAQELRFRHRDGSPRMCRVSGVPIELPDGEPGVLWSVIDVTELHQARDTIAFQASHDALTGLPNRRALEQHLPQVLGRRRRDGGLVAVGMLDLDDFKPVNDAHGHDAGDALLREFGGRLRALMRDADFLARFGGDEFVLVLDDLDEQACASQIEWVLQRLHTAVEQDFELPRGQRARVGMSLGLALMPRHGMDGETLLRQADAALYELKSHKHSRSSWWQIGACLGPAEASAGLDAFDARAGELLQGGALQAQLDAAACERRLRADSAGPDESVAAAALRDMAETEARHLQWLLGPDIDIAQIPPRGGERGRAHALMGLPAAMLTRCAARLREDIAAGLRAAPLMSRTADELGRIADARLQLDLQARVEAYERAVAEYFAVFDAPMPAPGTPWAQAAAHLLEAVAGLDGMLACLVMRPDSQGRFQVEAGAGTRAQAIGADLRTERFQVLQDDDTAAGRGLVGNAWRSGRVHSTGEYVEEERLQLWHALMRGYGVRSVMAIPVPAQQEGAAFVLALFGAWPAQFGTLRMRRFAGALQQRAAQLWRACRRTPQAPALPLELAQAYRSALFRGGLELHMQPVIDLRDGSVPRVEALARLRAPDGTLVPPASFLPLLGDAELDRLLRVALEQALGWLRRWEPEHPRLQVAVNLPPTTLLHPQCAQWVAQALQSSGIEPQRLTLELLETQEFEADSQEGAIEALSRLGVKLAIDDLGSGYNSLKRLAELPFDTIKVDQSLTLNLRRSPMLSFSLVSTLLKLGRDLGRQVIIEGAQDTDTVQAVFALGATLAQGFALARPMPAAQFQAWCAARRDVADACGVSGPLGALALHWALAHGGAAHVGVAQDCPVARWLRDCGATAEVLGWHEQLHLDPASWSNDQPFVAWLLRELRARP